MIIIHLTDKETGIQTGEVIFQVQYRVQIQMVGPESMFLITVILFCSASAGTLPFWLFPRYPSDSPAPLPIPSQVLD